MSKYKVGDKVVMKIISADQDEIKTYSVSGVNNDWRWCLPQNLLERYIEPLSTYTEPLEAKIRRQAAEITRLLSENKRLKAENGNGLWNIEQARAEGQNEAWELARKIVLMEKEGGMKDEDYKAIFGGCQPSDYILKTHTYPEAAAKVKAWKKAKEEIKVGDIVKSKSDIPVEFCVTEISCHGRLYGIGKNGGTYSNKNPEFWEKTGRHIDIDSFLKQIGGEQE